VTPTRLPVSVVTTLFNEADSVATLVESLFAQHLPPAEIVVADAGSTDGTREILARLATRHPSLRVIEVAGNRSQGRNAAIRASLHPHIACIDGGCRADPSWLELLAQPLADGSPWVAGFYRPDGPGLLAKCIGLDLVGVVEEVDPEYFLPSGRSMAFHRSIWEAVGGFPESAEFAEDTLFGESLRSLGHRPAFVGDAVVSWKPPPTFAAMVRTVFGWARWDGRVGLRGYTYKRMAKALGLGALGGLGLAFIRPVYGLAVLVPLAVVVFTKTRFRYRHAHGILKYIYIPFGFLLAQLSGLAGYVLGYLERRSGRGSMP